MIYLLTGQPGTGKSTVAVQLAIERYASQGRRVVANFPIDFSAICVKATSELSRSVVSVIADRPGRADLDQIGLGGGNEETAGLLIIDEAGIWLNARTWAGNAREQIIDWLTQSRKRYWDIVLIAQSTGMLDKQVREAVCEGVARIRRTDRVRIAGVRMPRVHVAIVRYGLDANAPMLERWVYRGIEAHKCFGSYRLFGSDSHPYSVLPATLTRWRYESYSRWVRTLSWFSQFFGGPALVPERSRKAFKASKHPLVAKLAQLPVEQRVRHFQRFERIGAFDLLPGPGTVQ